MISNKFRILNPPCPMCGGQPATDRGIILLLVLALITIIGLYINHINQPIKTDYSEIFFKNNIQASHTYNDSFIFENNTLYLTIDDFGELWGSSMQPTFFEGNTVLLEKYTNTTTLHTGDIIRYYNFQDKYPDCTTLHNAIGTTNTSMAVIHRISAIYDDRIVTQGDNINIVEDITRCQITHKVVGILFT